MKCYISILVFLASFGGWDLVYGQMAETNPHNFSADNWNYSERCNPCHVDNPDAAAGEQFRISYESDSLNAVDSLYLSGISKLCYACHDGTVAGFTHNTPLENTIGNDGTMHNHPVSILYVADSLKRNRLNNPNITMSGLGGTIAEDMLVNGRVECTSCHDAHFSMTKTSCKSCPPAPNAGVSSLWVKNNKSALCLICHDL